jgi:branched-chain amino acid transport system ATP-binding protein
MSRTLLSAEGIHVSYGGTQALAGVSFHVDAGETVALIGANGAGKSSAINAVAGSIPLASGKIRLDGKVVSGAPAHRIAELGIRLVPEGRQVFAGLTVADNLRLGAYRRMRSSAKAEAVQDMQGMLERFPVLKERLEQYAGSLSGGEQQMLAIARALMGRPRLLLLDEPSIGLAPKVVEAVFDTIRSLQSEGVTILLVEQMATKALAISHRAYVLELGRVVVEGPSGDVAANPLVEAAYLGGRRR